MVEYKVLITASGLGSRLGNLTKFTNKGLVRIGKKPESIKNIPNNPRPIAFIKGVALNAEIKKNKPARHEIKV